MSDKSVTVGCVVFDVLITMVKRSLLIVIQTRRLAEKYCAAIVTSEVDS